MKKLMILLAVVALIAGLGITRAEAADSAEITVRVTLTNLSISLDTTEWDIGTVAAEQQVTKTGITVTNDGGVDEKLTLSVDNTGCDWTFGDSPPDVNKFLMEFAQPTGGEFIIVIDTTPVSLIPSLPKDASTTLDLRFTAPTKNTAVSPEQVFMIIIIATPAA